MSVKINSPSPITNDVLLFGPMIESIYPQCVSHVVSNWKRGVCKRVAHAQPTPNYRIREDFFEFVDGIIKLLPVAEYVPVDRLLDDWLNNSNYNLKRRNLLRRKFKEFDLIHPHRWLKCKSFIKEEFYEEVKEPRIINSRTDWFKAKIGPYIHLVEKYVYDEHFIKHMLPADVAKRMEEIAEGYDLFYETDYSSFEGSFEFEFMQRVEYRMMRHVLQNFPEACYILDLVYNAPNRIIFQRMYSAQFKGSRMSGDMWTSLANGFTNYCLIKFYLHKNEAFGNFLVEGDDGFIACNKELDVSYAQALGFKLKIEVKRDHNSVQFCGLRVHDGILVPDIYKTLFKFGATQDVKMIKHFKKIGTNPKHAREFNNWFYSKAMSLLATGAGVPIVQEVALHVLNNVDGRLDYKYVDWWEKTFFNLSGLKPKPITISMREYVAREFNIPIKKQLKIEAEIRSCESQAYIIDL